MFVVQVEHKTTFTNITFTTVHVWTITKRQERGILQPAPQISQH